MMNKQKKETDYRFKILYAIGMIMVVSCHCENGGVSLLYNWFPPYLFHLGLFVFASGYFYKDDAEISISSYIRKKVKSLIVPLYMWNVFYALLVLLLSGVGFTIGHLQEYGIIGFIFNLILSPMLNGDAFIYNMGGWFVMPLFLNEIFNVAFRWLFRKWKGISKEIFLYICYLLLGCAGVGIAEACYARIIAGETVRYYIVLVMLVRVLYFLPFFGMGILYKRILEKYDRISNSLYFLLILVMQYGIIVLCDRVPEYIPSMGAIYQDGLIMPYIGGYLGIAFWLRISRILEPAIGRSKWINLIADNSFSIMVNHILGFMLVKGVFAVCQMAFGVFDTFDMQRFKSDASYVFYPQGKEQFLVFYVIAGIMFSIMLPKVIDGLKRFLKEHNSKRKAFLEV